jgi:hypothetical protein
MLGGQAIAGGALLLCRPAVALAHAADDDGAGQDRKTDCVFASRDTSARLSRHIARRREAPILG